MTFHFREWSLRYAEYCQSCLIACTNDMFDECEVFNWRLELWWQLLFYERRLRKAVRFLLAVENIMTYSVKILWNIIFCLHNGHFISFLNFTSTVAFLCNHFCFRISKQIYVDIFTATLENLQAHSKQNIIEKSSSTCYNCNLHVSSITYHFKILIPHQQSH